MDTPPQDLIIEPPRTEGPSDALDLGFLESLVGYSIRRAQLRVFEDFHRAFRELGLRPAQFGVLAVIADNPGRSQREIAAALGIQRPNFVAMMDSLEARGLALRQVSETDRRSYAITLTPAGKQLLCEARLVVADHEARVMARLTAAERVKLIGLLHRL